MTQQWPTCLYQPADKRVPELLSVFALLIVSFVRSVDAPRRIRAGTLCDSRELNCPSRTDLDAINRFLPSSVVWTTVLLALFRKVQEEDRKMRETLSQVLQKLTGRRWR